MANDSSMISAKFNKAAQNVETRAVFQYDHGLTLLVYGLESVSIRQIHFANTNTGNALNILTT